MASMQKKLIHALQTTAMILLGNFLVAFLVCAFISPHGILISGITGISFVLTRIIPLNMATVVLILNVFMLLLGLFLLGKKFFFATVVSSLVYPAFLAIMERIPGLDHLTDNSFISLCRCVSGSWILLCCLARWYMPIQKRLCMA